MKTPKAACFTTLATGPHQRRIAVTQSPGDVLDLTALGVGYADAGDAIRGEAWLRRAVALSGRDPDLAEGIAALALRCGHYVLAQRCLRRTIGDAASNPDRLVALARAEAHLAPQGNWRRLLARAVAVDPSSGGVHRVAAALERQAGRLAAARGAARIAVAVCPALADAHAELARADLGLGHAPCAARRLARAVVLAPDRADLANQSVLTDIYFASPRTLGEKVRHHAALVRRSIRPLEALARDPDPERRLKIAYVSADFNDHPVAHNLIGLVERHDRASFELVFLSNATRTDGLTRRFAALGSYRSVLGLDDRRLADLIAAEKVDILVSLAGRFAGNRPALTAFRSAPVQFSMHDITSTGDAASSMTLRSEERRVGKEC